MAWTELANLRGAQGDKGDKGDVGPKGDPGTGGGTSLSEKYVIQDNATVNPGDVFGYRGSRVMATNTVTGISGANPWISAANYVILSGGGATFNAYDYGVRATGNDADAVANSAALARAVDAAFQIGGGVVQLPAGNIRFSGNLALKQGVSLVGAGVLATVLQAAAGSNYNYLVGNEVAASASGKNHMWVAVRNLMLDGRRANQTAGTGHGVRLSTNPINTKAAGDNWFDPHHVLDNVWVYMCRGNGFHFEGRSALQATKLFASQCDGWGYWSTFDTNISHAESDSCKLGGFRFNNGSNRVGVLKAFLSGSGVAGSTSPGFYFGSNAYAVVGVALEAQNNTGPGFFLDGCRHVTLSGASAESNWKDPMGDGPGPSGAGFKLVGATHCTISGSSTQGLQNGVLIGNQQNGVSFDAGSTGNSVTVTHGGIYNATVGPATAGALDPTTNVVVANGEAVAGLSGGDGGESSDPVQPKGWSPADRGWNGWSFDILFMNSMENASTGRHYFSRVKATTLAPITRLGINVKNVGAGVTAEMAIYDRSTKALLASGAVDMGGTGLRWATLDTPVSPPEVGAEYFVTLLVTAATTAPSVAKCGSNIGDMNLGLSGDTLAIGHAGSGLAASPAVLGTLAWSAGAAYWMVAG